MMYHTFSVLNVLDLPTENLPNDLDLHCPSKHLCLSNTLKPHFVLPGTAVVSPGYGNMMGGKKVIVTGPCYSPSDIIECKFGDITVPGIRIDATNAMCVTPLAGSLGRIPFSVTTDEGSTYSHNGTFVYCKICLSSLKLTINLNCFCLARYGYCTYM